MFGLYASADAAQFRIKPLKVTCPRMLNESAVSVRELGAVGGVVLVIVVFWAKAWKGFGPEPGPNEENTGMSTRARNAANGR
jgi:hypothetical protein